MSLHQSTVHLLVGQTELIYHSRFYQPDPLCHPDEWLQMLGLKEVYRHAVTEYQRR